MLYQCLLVLHCFAVSFQLVLIGFVLCLGPYRGIVLGQFSVVLNWFCFMFGAIPRQMKVWEMLFRPWAAGFSGLNEWTVPEFPVWTGLIQAPMQMGLVFGYGFGSGFCSGRFHLTRVITPGAQSVLPAVAGVCSSG